MGLLDDKVAIITGAGNGLGRAEAFLFAAEGAKLVVNDAGVGLDGTGSDPRCAQSVAKQLVAAGAQAVANTDDISTAEGAAKLVATTLDRFGQLDILVNNAGIAPSKTLLKLDETTWQRVLAINLTGAWRCLQSAARQMVTQGQGGRIVNTAGIAGLRGSMGHGCTAAAEGGVFGLTRTAAIELQKYRITVNAIAPIALTRLTEDWPTLQGLEHLDPEHVAPAALFFASELCQDRSGEVLGVAGSRIYGFKLVESEGKFKDGHEPWTAAEIAEHWRGICRS